MRSMIRALAACCLDEYPLHLVWNTVKGVTSQAELLLTIGSWNQLQCQSFVYAVGQAALEVTTEEKLKVALPWAFPELRDATWTALLGSTSTKATTELIQAVAASVSDRPAFFAALKLADVVP